MSSDFAEKLQNKFVSDKDKKKEKVSAETVVEAEKNKHKIYKDNYRIVIDRMKSRIFVSDVKSGILLFDINGIDISSAHTKIDEIEKAKSESIRKKEKHSKQKQRESLHKSAVYKTIEKRIESLEKALNKMKK